MKTIQLITNTAMELVSLANRQARMLDLESVIVDRIRNQLDILSSLQTLKRNGIPAPDGWSYLPRWEVVWQLNAAFNATEHNFRIDALRWAYQAACHSDMDMDAVAEALRPATQDGAKIRSIAVGTASYGPYPDRVVVDAIHTDGVNYWYQQGYQAGQEPCLDEPVTRQELEGRSHLQGWGMFAPEL